MDSLDEFFKVQQRNVRRSLRATERRIEWARESGTKATPANSTRLLTLPGTYDVEERRGSIAPTSAMGHRRQTLSELDGDAHE